MDVERDLEKIALQEKRLQFPRFDAEAAWKIGAALKTEAEKRGAAVAIDVRLHGQPLFYCAMPGTTPDNADWIRRKSNVTARYSRSSYAVGLSLQRDGATLQAKIGAEVKDYAPHGGSFPILLQGGLSIGSVTVSGLPQRQDHNLVVDVLADCLGIPRQELALD